MKLPSSPLIYEINTWPWLAALSAQAGAAIDLSTVPDDQWDAIADLGFDAIWLMGVWRRSPAGVAIARGDPYFAAWRDVVQINPLHPELREAAASTLRSIAAQCDGVRCDMAMLVMNDVFTRTWGAAAGSVPGTDYWPGLIGAVHTEHPEFRFIAEAYWDTESALAAQGFGHCYDKALYDTLRHDPGRLRATLISGTDTPNRLLRFVENHDEERAAVAFAGRDRRAAVAALTQSGARLVHQGQVDGRRIRIPVQLGRCPDEPVDADRAVFYRALLRVVGDADFSDGAWYLCDTSSDAVVVWERIGRRQWIVAVNISEHEARTRVLVNVGDGYTGEVGSHDEDRRPAILDNPLTGQIVNIDADGSVELSMVAGGWQLY